MSVKMQGVHCEEMHPSLMDKVLSKKWIGTKLSDDKWDEPEATLKASLKINFCFSSKIKPKLLHLNSLQLEYVDVYWIHHPAKIKGALMRFIVIFGIQGEFLPHFQIRFGRRLSEKTAHGE